MVHGNFLYQEAILASFTVLGIHKSRVRIKDSNGLIKDRSKQEVVTSGIVICGNLLYPGPILAGFTVLEECSSTISEMSYTY